MSSLVRLAPVCKINLDRDRPTYNYYKMFKMNLQMSGFEQSYQQSHLMTPTILDFDQKVQNTSKEEIFVIESAYEGKFVVRVRVSDWSRKINCTQKESPPYNL